MGGCKTCLYVLIIENLRHPSVWSVCLFAESFDTMESIQQHKFQPALIRQMLVCWRSALEKTRHTVVCVVVQWQKDDGQVCVKARAHTVPNSQNQAEVNARQYKWDGVGGAGAGGQSVITPFTLNSPAPEPRSHLCTIKNITANNHGLNKVGIATRAWADGRR